MQHVCAVSQDPQAFPIKLGRVARGYSTLESTSGKIGGNKAIIHDSGNTVQKRTTVCESHDIVPGHSAIDPVDAVRAERVDSSESGVENSVEPALAVHVSVYVQVWSTWCESTKQNTVHTYIQEE
jgi:hypothetical protein